MIGVTAAQVAVVVLLGVALTLPHLPQRTCRYAAETPSFVLFGNGERA